MRILVLFLVFIVTACTTPPIMKQQIAHRIASPVWMIPRTVPAGPFTLSAYERMHTRHASANVYIEGDGFGIEPPHGKDFHPTPLNPVALHMASKDKADNVVYLARPCQFDSIRNEACSDDTYWTSARFSETVVSAYNAALNDIKALYNVKSFNLIGFDGGGAIATLLAAERSDVLSLRTVAGNLDIETYASYHNRLLLNDSLNPLAYAEKLRNLPQWHFIGGQDHKIPPVVLQHYLQASEPSSCISYDLIQENEHEDGWAEKWNVLLAKKPTCERITSEPVKQEFMDYVPPEPFYQPRVLDLNKSGK